MKTFSIFTFCIFTLSSFAVSIDTRNWRNWTVLDGLVESYATNIELVGNDFMLITPGLKLLELSLLDGYQVQTIPISKLKFNSELNDINRLNALTANGSVYLLERPDIRTVKTIHRFAKWEKNHWKYYECPIPFVSDDMKVLHAMDESTLLLLFTDEILKWNTENNAIDILYESNSDDDRFIDLFHTTNNNYYIFDSTKLIAFDPNFLQFAEYKYPNQLFFIHFVSLYHDHLYFARDFNRNSDTQYRKFHFTGNSVQEVSDQKQDFVLRWHGEDDSQWSYHPSSQTHYSLKKIYPNGFEEQTSFRGTLIKTKFKQGNNNMFWIIVNDSIAQYAPLAWRSPYPVKQINKSVHTIKEDSVGRVWFACEGMLVCCDGDQWKIYPLPDSASTTWYMQSSLGFVNGKVILLTSTDYLVQFDPETETFSKIDTPDGKRFSWFIGNRNTNDLLVETEIKNNLIFIEKYDGNSFQPLLSFNHNTEFSSLFRNIKIDANNNYWIASDSGFYCHDGDDFIPLTQPKDDMEQSGFSILHKDEETAWFGGRNSILQYQNNEWIVMKTGTDQVHEMILDKKGTVWVASWSGVYKYDGKSWSSVTFEDGLPSSSVMTVFEDSRGRIWAGTMEGISLYHPDADLDNPQTYISEKDNIQTFAPNSESQFVFSGMDKWKHTEADRLYYSHRIDQNEWSAFSTSNTAIYPNLPSGNHTFEVRAMDRNWNVDPTPDKWDFVVLNHWYMEPGFIISAIFSTILTLIALIYALNRHFRLKENYATLQNTQNQLIQSEKMASLGQLVAGVAHEINNPVNYIKSNIEPLKEYLLGYKEVVDHIQLLKEKLPDDAKRSLEKLIEKNDLDFADEDSKKIFESYQEGSNRIADIVADLRQYSKTDKEYYSKMDLHESIESTLNLLKSKLKEGISIHKDFGNIPKINCSPGQMGQVFMNLLSNAIDAVGEQGTIQIATSQEKRYVVIAIRDDGPGIPIDIQSKIFDPFFTTKPVGSGTGLGLSITHTIIEQHNGKIEVTSEENVGAIFAIHLPLK